MNPSVLMQNLISEAPPPTYEKYLDLRERYSSKKEIILYGLEIC